MSSVKNIVHPLVVLFACTLAVCLIPAVSAWEAISHHWFNWTHSHSVFVAACRRNWKLVRDAYKHNSAMRINER